MTVPAFAPEHAFSARLGFLGVGWMALERLEALSRLDVAEIAAVCDPSRYRVARARALATGAVACTSIEQMVDLDLDGIVICTPTAFHVGQCIECLDWGLPVFCQRPLARNATETTAVVLEAQTQDRLLDVDLRYRHLGAVEAITDLVGSGKLGDVHAARLVFHDAHGPDQPWFRDASLSGGGCVIDLATHLVDLAVRVLGSPVEDVESTCFADGRPLERPIDEIEDYATARLRLASGAVVDLACSWNITLGRDAVIEADFVGDRGGARLRNVGGSLHEFVAVHTQGTQSRVLADPPGNWETRALASWARRLGERGGFDCEAWNLVHLSRVIDEIYGRQRGEPVGRPTPAGPAARAAQARAS